MVIGDVHGERFFERIDIRAYYKVIFLGDYFDSYDRTSSEQIKVFKLICNMKWENPDKVELLLGNHDMHYYDTHPFNKSMGFQNDMQFKYHDLLHEDGLDLKLAYQIKTLKQTWLFSHAGISRTYMKEMGCSTIDETVEVMNNSLTASIHQYCSHENRGYDKFDGPLWIRPFHLLIDKPDNVIQIVGHTPTWHIDLFGGQLENKTGPMFIDGVHFMDCKQPVELLIN